MATDTVPRCHRCGEKASQHCDDFNRDYCPSCLYANWNMGGHGDHIHHDFKGRVTYSPDPEARS